MEQLIGTSLTVFVGVTVLLMGFASYMTGQALAGTWRPMWQTVPYALLLGCVDRFLVWGLFHGELFLLSGYLIDSLVILAIAALAYRLMRVHKMVTQYPWLYERSGVFGWRPRR